MLPSRFPRKVALIAAVLIGVGALGAARIFLRGPDLDYFPPMVEMTDVAGKPLWVQAREVTIGEWARCHADGACTLELRAPPRAKEGEDWPATGLSYVDVNEYVAWINQKSRHSFRLPSAIEWDFLAAPVMPVKPDPIFSDPALSWASTYLTENLVDRRLRPSQSWDSTPEGIWDLNGNVWEWTQDCFKGLSDGTPDGAGCPAFIVGGEHEAVIPYLVRDPARGGCAVGAPPPHLGMRLVSDDPV